MALGRLANLKKKHSVHELCSITTKAKEYLHDNFMKKDT